MVEPGGLQVGDRAWEFAQEANANNGRIGQQGRVKDTRTQPRRNPGGFFWKNTQALIEFDDGHEEWIDFRFLRKLDAVDALGKLVTDG